MGKYSKPTKFSWHHCPNDSGITPLWRIVCFHRDDGSLRFWGILDANNDAAMWALYKSQENFLKHFRCGVIRIRSFKPLKDPKDPEKFTHSGIEVDFMPPKLMKAFILSSGAPSRIGKLDINSDAAMNEYMSWWWLAIQDPSPCRIVVKPLNNTSNE